MSEGKVVVSQLECFDIDSMKPILLILALIGLTQAKSELANDRRKRLANLPVAPGFAPVRPQLFQTSFQPQVGQSVFQSRGQFQSQGQTQFQPVQRPFRLEPQRQAQVQGQSQFQKTQNPFQGPSQGSQSPFQVSSQFQRAQSPFQVNAQGQSQVRGSSQFQTAQTPFRLEPQRQFQAQGQFQASRQQQPAPFRPQRQQQFRTGNQGSGAAILRYDADLGLPTGYSYAVETSDGSKTAVIGKVENPDSEEGSLAVEGLYSYIGDDGQNYTVHYTADENGFQPAGQHIPPAASTKKLGIPSAALASLAGGGLG